MSKGRRYPLIGIRSKNELAKRISSKQFPPALALELINDVLENFDRYWYDSPDSQPEKGKFIRSAFGNKLGKLLALIDAKVLAPHDDLVPDFIFGGLAGKSHIQAAGHLRGKRRKRSLLGLDISRFFEQVHQERVWRLFCSKCGCSKKAGQLLARLCCVPLGPKGSGSVQKSLARGFATSPRLSLWCNLDTFLRLEWVVKRKLRAYDPRIAIFVDDIGVTASRVDKLRFAEVATILEKVLADFDSRQPLPINRDKKKILESGEMEHLGLKLGKRMSLGRKALAKRDKIRKALQTPLSKEDRIALKKRERSYRSYERQIDRESQR